MAPVAYENEKWLTWLTCITTGGVGVVVRMDGVDIVVWGLQREHDPLLTRIRILGRGEVGQEQVRHLD